MSARTARNFDYSEFAEDKNSERVFTVSRCDDSNVTATFSFRDDCWSLLNILRPHERDSQARINFASIPAWLREESKYFIAHEWMRTEPSANKLQQFMVVLRQLAKLLPDFTGKPTELRACHARKFARGFCDLNYSAGTNSKTQIYANKFIAFVRQHYPKCPDIDFKVQLPRTKTYIFDYMPADVSRKHHIDAGTMAKIVDACAAEVRAYQVFEQGRIDPNDSKAVLAAKAKWRREYDAEIRHGVKRPRCPSQWHSSLLGRAIKAQAVLVAICTGRRVSAVCNTKVDVLTDKVTWTNEAGEHQQVVMMRFRESKVSGADEDVPCPDAYGDLVLKAVETAKELTIDLRRDNPQWGEFLFLVPAKERKIANVLSAHQMNHYINGAIKQEKHQGLLSRYGIVSERKITTHHFRHTRATVGWLGGLQVHEVQQDLGHRSPDVTARYYIAGGEEPRRRLQELMDHGALGGRFSTLVGGQEIVRAQPGARQVEVMQKQKRVIAPTRYGYCALGGTGPCARTLPCYLGVSVNDGGCDQHLLSPDAIPALEEDKRTLEATISAYEGDPAYRVWVEHHRIQLAVVNNTVEHAKILQQKLHE